MPLDVEYKAPDGGWGWMIVAVSFVLQALSVGLTYTFGIIYVELLNYFKDSPSTTAWIGSMQPALLYFICVVTGPLLLRLGWRAVTIIGTLISASGFFLSYLAPNVYVLFVTYGVMTGIGYGLMYMVSMVTVQHYFDEKRSLATGIAVSGSGMGTVVFGIVTSELLKLMHWRLTLLVEGGITLVFGLICAALLTPLKKENVSAEIDPLLASQIDPRLRAGSYGSTGSSISTPESLTPLSYATARDSYRSPNSDMFSGDDLAITPRRNPSPIRSLGSSSNRSSQSTPSPVSSLGRSSFKSLSPMPTISDIEEDRHCCRCSTCCARPCCSCACCACSPCCSFSPCCSNTCCSSPCCSTPCCSSPCCSSPCCLSIRHCACIGRCNAHFRFNLFKNPILVLYCLAVVCFCFGYHVPYTFTTNKAIAVCNIGSTEASLLVSIMGIANLSSRLVFGWVGDNSASLRHWMMGTVILLCGVLNIIMFLFNTFPLLVCYSILFGTLSGCFASMVPVVLVDQMGLELIEFTLGQVLASGSIAFLVAAPMSGWIIEKTGSFDAPFLVVGLAQVVGGLAFYLIPLVRKRWPQSCHTVTTYDEITIRRTRRRSRMFSESIA